MVTWYHIKNEFCINKKKDKNEQKNTQKLKFISS